MTDRKFNNIIFAAALGILAVGGPLLAWNRVSASDDAPAARLVACSDRTDVVSVWRDDPTPCDVHGAQRLDIYGFTLAECDAAGGEYVLVNSDGNAGPDIDPDRAPRTFVCEGADR